ncbi:MAG TPA: hypothetical protein VFZ34_19390 [Blastocatellia bacterium]|nr:hypothetical protein [Blastocatellia bacterium]
MKPDTHRTEEAFDRLCREIVSAAQASEEDIHAAANTPFLYHRLRAQIAATQNPTLAQPPPRKAQWNFVAAFTAWQKQWRWALALTTVGVVLLALAGWRWMMPAADAPAVANRQITPTLPATATPMPNEAQEQQEQQASNEPQKITSAVPAERKAVHQAPRNTARFAAETIAEETEIATEFMPLTYAENRDDESSHIVRMEVPRDALIALGIPLAKELTSDRIKADVKMGDDGVALAIRLISNQND